MFPSSISASSSRLNIYRVTQCLSHFQFRVNAALSCKFHTNSYGSYLVIRQYGMLSQSEKAVKWQCLGSDQLDCKTRFFSNRTPTLEQKVKPSTNKDIVESKEKPFSELSTSQKGTLTFIRVKSLNNIE